MKAKFNFIDWKSLLSFAGVGIVGLVFILALSDSLSERITGWLFGNQFNGTIVARLVQLDGKAKVISGNRERQIVGPLSEPTLFADGDRLEVSENATASLILNSQDEFMARPSTSIMFQLWNPLDGQSPIYVTVLSGQLDLQKAGVRGRAYLVKNGRLYMPGQEIQPPRTSLTINHKEIDLELSENQLTEDAEPLETQVEVEPGMDRPNGIEPETLSNEYIDESIGRKQLQLQKCWLSRIKNSPIQKGKLVVQFEINRRGKVKDPKIIDSEFKDETLHNCIIGVIERINFRSFKGPEISLSYPIQLE